MQTKKLLYAAVGAPIVAAKSAQARVGEIRLKLGESAESLTKDLESQLEQWAAEGEVLLGRIGDSKAIDELTERMDLDQVQEQVGKLREQIEDLLDTWRSNFRPGSGRDDGSPLPQPRPAAAPGEQAGDVQAAAPEPPTPRPTAGKPTDEKPASQKPASQKPASQKSAAGKAAAEKPAGGSSRTTPASSSGRTEGSEPGDAPAS